LRKPLTLIDCVELSLLVYIKKCHVFNKREGTEEDSKARMKKTRRGVRVLEQEVDKYRKLFYDLQASMEKKEQCRKIVFFLGISLCSIWP